MDGYKGLLLASAGIDADRAEDVRSEIMHQLQEIRDGNITDEELAYAKAGIESDLISMLDSAPSLETFFTNNLVDGSDYTPESFAERVNDVTKDEVAAVAQSVVPDLVYLLRGEAE